MRIIVLLVAVCSAGWGSWITNTFVKPVKDTVKSVKDTITRSDTKTDDNAHTLLKTTTEILQNFNVNGKTLYHIGSGRRNSQNIEW